MKVGLLKKLRTILKDKSGVSFPLVADVTLSSLLIFCGVSEYLRPQTITTDIRDAVENAVISAVNDNYAGVYHGVRKGYSGGYTPYGKREWGETLDRGNIYTRIDKVLGIRKSGGRHVKFAGDNGNVVELALTDLNVTLRNTFLAPPDPGNTQRFETETVIRLKVPVRFGRKFLLSIRITLWVQVGYTEVF